MLTYSSLYTHSYTLTLIHFSADPAWSRSRLDSTKERGFGGFTLGLLDESRYRQIYHELLQGMVDTTSRESNDECIRGLAHRIFHDNAIPTPMTTPTPTPTMTTTTTTNSTHKHMSMSKKCITRIHEIIDTILSQ